MTDKNTLIRALIQVDPAFSFHLEGDSMKELPTLQENQEWLAKYEEELPLAGSSYWNILKDINLRKVLNRVISDVETLEKNNKSLPTAEELETMVYSSTGIRTFAGKLDDYVAVNV